MSGTDDKTRKRYINRGEREERDKGGQEESDSLETSKIWFYRIDTKGMAGTGRRLSGWQQEGGLWKDAIIHVTLTTGLVRLTTCYLIVEGERKWPCCVSKPTCCVSKLASEKGDLMQTWLRATNEHVL